MTDSTQIEIDAPLPSRRKRNLPLSAPLDWLAGGWRDLWTVPAPSLLYGLAVASLSALVVVGMVFYGWDHILFPALSAFLVVAPALATGLYEKSHRIAEGRPVRLTDMVLIKRGAGYHILFIGAILALLAMLWMRAAVLLFALFWGWLPFPGLGRIVEMLFSTPEGWALMVTGTLVGGLFAALGFAISAFSIPLLLDRKLDAFTAMGISMSYAWHNKGVMVVWGAIILALCAVSILTGFAGFVLIFPLLGHATWHSYKAICDEPQ
ncbi:DUF2189 domain-containing protein [Pelagibacterium limicola]|uniref:DUF2189 domain-containing protein n=1 Tax=Pelagibacterium limicola TaxID=2791022 RepID=UPI0018AF884A|nr:DUF2189 domain-containing protein [Pelagibacterium limicola]